MKVKKLIELLQEYPEDLEVCIPTEDGNVDILCLDHKPGYYDGAYQILKRDWSLNCVIGAIYTSAGDKLVIFPHSIQDAMLDEPELPVDVVDTFVEKRMQKTVDRWREKNRKIHANVEEWQQEREKDDN